MSRCRTAAHIGHGDGVSPRRFVADVRCIFAAAPRKTHRCTRCRRAETAVVTVEATDILIDARRQNNFFGLLDEVGCRCLAAVAVRDSYRVFARTQVVDSLDGRAGIPRVGIKGRTARAADRDLPVAFPETGRIDQAYLLDRQRRGFGDDGLKNRIRHGIGYRNTVSAGG